MDDQVLMIELSRLDGNDTQTRSAVRPQAVEEYAEKIRAGEQLDPAIVYHDGDRYFLAAGFHRREAYRAAGHSAMPCLVRSGGRWEAIEAGLADNRKHVGERLTRADKRFNIELVLREKSGMSNCQVASLVGVSDKTVASVRADLESCSEIPRSVVRTGSDGRRFSVPIKPDPYGRPEPWLRPLDTDTKHCHCGGTWVSDGQGQRYCEECRGTHPWDEFPLPELIDSQRYGTKGINDDLAMLDPVPGAPGWFYMSHFRHHDEGWEVVCTMRGLKADCRLITECLYKSGFLPSAGWEVEPALGQRPDYIPTEEQRWEVERATWKHYDGTGKFPWEDSEGFRQQTSEPPCLEVAVPAANCEPAVTQVRTGQSNLAGP